MGHLPTLIEDLALILFSGAMVTLLFRKLKQPLVLGYIIAGLLVGPHISLVPTVVEERNIKILAELGVIFLLFSLGLEFSFKKLMRVGGSASVTAFVEIAFILVAGYLAGKWMGWGQMDSIFLGALLASSSTTIIIRAFEELGVKSKRFAGVVFGVLVVEDLVVILLLVLLPAIAVSREFEGGAMLMTLVKLLFFLILWFVLGIFLIPTFLKKMRHMLDEEMLLMLSIGLCLGMVVLATKAGFSAELGAFIMGSILAETTSAEKIEHLFKPVKDVFGAVFFVSVGMMIDPAAMWEYRMPILIVTLLTIFGKFFSSGFGALLSGQPLKQSVQVGMSMAQIGEFAFIIAGLGVTLNVTSDFLFPVAVGVSALTTFTTPYMIKSSDSAYQLLLKIIPEKWVNSVNLYASSTQKIQAESAWKKVIKSYTTILITNGIVIIAILLLSINLLEPFLLSKIKNMTYVGVVGVFVTLLLAAPFFWGLMMKRPAGLAYKELWMNSIYNRGPLLMIEITRNLIGASLIGLLLDRYFSGEVALLILLPIILVLYYVLGKKIQQFYGKLESRFLTNLNAREAAANAKRPLLDLGKYDISDWETHISQHVVSPNATFLGKSLLELKWREKYGVNIAFIKRGDNVILPPKREEILFPADEIGVIATDEQLSKFQPVLEASEDEAYRTSTSKIEDVGLQRLVVDEHLRFKGMTIHDSGIREKTDGLVIRVEREDQHFINPSSDTMLEWGDVIWLVGNKQKIQALKEA
ncbi:cation:proton antiporter [Arachidicoccus terrestris]|uniref:cation:proton antiporter n=1 Tax=Arachidicoccus terrestris TaxID=2875539 RepID=UPI001CC678B7|nr:cation:proton antiporter [Arachidicoccus terrestris]UAY56781.1 cation:proton antiporter [Arachidicoccus terrestris]